MKSRNWTLTLNYFTETDIEEMIDLGSECSYYIFCIEGDECPEHHYHIHVYYHLPTPRSMNGILKRFSKHHHIEVVQDIPNMIQYIKGYEKGKLKCDTCELCVFEEGIVPENGVSTTSKLVIKALQDGKDYKYLLDNFPSYCIHHGDKVKTYLKEVKPKQKTQFYVIQPIGDALTEIANYFDGTDMTKAAIVTELTQLNAYDDYDTVIYYATSVDRLHSLWPRGVPITYRYGYKTEIVKCSKFIIVTDYPKCYELYKNIN